MVVKQGTHVNASLINPNPSSLRDHTKVPQRMGEALGGLVSTGAQKPITVWENSARPSDAKGSYYRKLPNKIFSEVKKNLRTSQGLVLILQHSEALSIFPYHHGS